MFEKLKLASHKSWVVIRQCSTSVDVTQWATIFCSSCTEGSEKVAFLDHLLCTVLPASPSQRPPKRPTVSSLTLSLSLTHTHCASVTTGPSPRPWPPLQKCPPPPCGRAASSVRNVLGAASQSSSWRLPHSWQSLWHTSQVRTNGAKKAAERLL